MDCNTQCWSEPFWDLTNEIENRPNQIWTFPHEHFMKKASWQGWEISWGSNHSRSSTIFKSFAKILGRIQHSGLGREQRNSFIHGRNNQCICDKNWQSGQIHKWGKCQEDCWHEIILEVKCFQMWPNFWTLEGWRITTNKGETRNQHAGHLCKKK